MKEFYVEVADEHFSLDSIKPSDSRIFVLTGVHRNDIKRICEQTSDESQQVASSASQGMRQLNSVYTQYLNHTHHRVGHVFQGRYKGILVDKESYFLELTRYAVLNPVRAHMVSDEKDWP